MSGKGDKVKPHDKKKYDEGYENIKWTKPKKKVIDKNKALK